MNVELGSYKLLKALGKGGHGEVWLAEHSRTSARAAVKIDLHPPAPEAVAAFLHEVEIIAGLDHPNIARILEHGSVDIDAQDASRGHFRDGARWLAMELAPGGSLVQMQPRSWREMLHVAHGLLGALAHAHARGITHRDIKPGNLLMAGPEVGIDVQPESLLEARVVLSDFGISERRETPSMNTADAVGTPHYMAPEQIEARWRDQGPATDLYAVGVLLWRLTTGRYPFQGKNAFNIYRGHLMSPVPDASFYPGVPRALEPILRRCLAKDHRERYAFAVDLLDALNALRGGQLRRSAPIEDLPTERVTGALETESTATGTTGVTRERTEGLTLFGLRTPPLVGRTAEVTTLWRAFESACEGSARVVILRGPQGCGRTRLGQWLCETAHERGRSVPWVARHEPGVPHGETLRRMLRDHLRTGGLEPEALSVRLRQRFPEERIDLKLLESLLRGDARAARLAAREERMLVLNVLQQIATERPLVLWLEDAHHDPETVELVDHLLALQHRRPSPILVLLSVRDQELSDRPELSELLAELSEDPAVQTVALGPLDPFARAHLIRSLVGLDGAVSRRLEERTQGNPQFAVELVRNWIELGVLTPGPRGFVLNTDHERAAPSSLTAIWADRLQRALAGFGSGDALAVEAAAAMGMHCTRDGFHHLCELLEITPDPDLLPGLVRAHLIEMDEGGTAWRFTHGLLIEVLEARSRKLGRWVDVNLAAAIHIRELSIHAPGRVARHLIAAEEWEPCIEPLIEAQHDLFESGDTRDTENLDLLERAFTALDLPADDPDRGRLALLRVALARIRFQFDAALDILQDVLRRDHGAAVTALALRESARIHLSRNHPEIAKPFAERAIRAFETLGDPMRAADSERTLGEILLQTGEREAGIARLEHAVEELTANGWEDYLFAPLYTLARTAQQAGDHDTARHWLARTRTLAERLSMQLVLANCANIEGEIARYEGDFEAAATWYANASARYEAMDNAVFVFPTLNLGLLDVGAGRHAVALERMRQLLRHFEVAPQAVAETFAHVVLAAAAAGAGELDAAVESITRVEADVARNPLVDTDLARMAESTGNALRVLRPEPARRALALARAQFEALGRPEDVARVDRTLALWKA